MNLTPSLLASPTVQSAIVAAIGVGLVWLRWRRSGATLIALACLWLWLCATPAMAGWLQNSLDRPFPPRDAILYPHADAIMLVGGGALPPHRGDWDANRNPALATPLGFVLALYRANKADDIVISAGEYTSGRLVAMLRVQGVPASALPPAGTSLSTHQDALLATPLLQRMHASRILLVTYASHMPRSVAVFRKQGFKVIAAPSFNSPGSALAGPAWWPSGKALHLTRAGLHEYLGLAWYRLRGWAIW